MTVAMRYGKLKNEVRDALKGAFPIKDEFVLVVADADLTDGMRQYTYDDFEVGAGLHETVIQKVVDWAESADSLSSLLEAAIKRRRTHQRLKDLAAQVSSLRPDKSPPTITPNGIQMS